MQCIAANFSVQLKVALEKWCQNGCCLLTFLNFNIFYKKIIKFQISNDIVALCMTKTGNTKKCFSSSISCHRMPVYCEIVPAHWWAVRQYCEITALNPRFYSCDKYIGLPHESYVNFALLTVGKKTILMVTPMLKICSICCNRWNFNFYDWDQVTNSAYLLKAG